MGIHSGLYRFGDPWFGWILAPALSSFFKVVPLMLLAREANPPDQVKWNGFVREDFRLIVRGPITMCVREQALETRDGILLNQAFEVVFIASTVARAEQRAVAPCYRRVDLKDGSGALFPPDHAPVWKEPAYHVIPELIFLPRIPPTVARKRNCSGFELPSAEDGPMPEDGLKVIGGSEVVHATKAPPTDTLLEGSLLVRREAPQIRHDGGRRSLPLLRPQRPLRHGPVERVQRLVSPGPRLVQGEAVLFRGGVLPGGLRILVEAFSRNTGCARPSIPW